MSPNIWKMIMKNKWLEGGGVRCRGARWGEQNVTFILELINIHKNVPFFQLFSRSYLFLLSFKNLIYFLTFLHYFTYTFNLNLKRKWAIYEKSIIYGLFAILQNHHQYLIWLNTFESVVQHVAHLLGIGKVMGSLLKP